MKKIYLMMVAAVMATNVWASATTYEKVNSVPGQEAFITDIYFDATTNTLTFTDKFEQNQLYDRKYLIDFYEWIPSGSHETGIYKVTNSGQTVYVYGYPVMGTGNKIACIQTTYISQGGNRVSKEVDVVNSTGGLYSVKIGKEIDRILASGKYRLHIVVSVQVNKNGEYLCPETNAGLPYGRELNCFVNGYTGQFSYNDLYVRDPKFYENPKKVLYGDSVKMSALIKGTGQTTYYLQESSDDSESWRTVASGSIPGTEVRELYTLNLGVKFEEEGRDVPYWYRLVLEDNNSHVTDTSNYLPFHFFYPWKDGEDTTYHCAGNQFNYPLPADCEKYHLTSTLPVKQFKNASTLRYTQPACPVELKRIDPLYSVRFYNADNTILSVCMTECGHNATPPANPAYGKYEFTGWSRDFTNVHSDMNVYARYDLGGDYFFETAFVGHKNELHPTEGFESSETRAMIGDSLSFEASICAKFEMNLKYQIADAKDNKGNWLWGDPLPAGTFSAEEASKSWNEAKTFRVTRAVGYDNWQEKMNVPGYAFRFVVYCQGEAIYSEPWELDVYYPITVKSQIDAWFDPSLLEQLTVFNNSGDQYTGATVTIPARMQDTVWVAMEKGQGACLQFARKTKTDPKYAVSEGEDALNRKFFLCPNETETIDVTVKKYAVVFENAEPWNNYDFSAEGLHKWNNKYYAEVVRCGGAVKKMPQDPVRANEIFLGWINNTTSQYADDDYLHVPALDGTENYLIFEAKWEDKAAVEQHSVRFLDKEGNPIGEVQKVYDGADAVPPTAPTVTGWHFAGWDKPYTCITSDIDIQAMYGLDDTYWTVTYFDEDGTTELSSEQVLDNMGVKGFIHTKAGKKFHQWIDKATGNPANLEHITANLSVKASFVGAQHNVTFRVDGVETYSVVVEHGALFSQIVYPYSLPTKAQTEAAVYTFKGWTPELTTINGDVTFDAVFEETARKYTVRFQNWDHSEIETQQVAYGTAATAPSKKPVRAGYTFTGWDMPFDNIKTDLVVTALFKAGVTYYKVTLAAEHGTITCQEENIDLGKVAENTVLHFTATPETGYVFKSWQGYDPASGLTVTEDCTVTAEFEKESQGVDNAPSDQVPSTKLLRDGQIYIIRGDKTYTLTGVEVK